MTSEYAYMNHGVCRFENFELREVDDDVMQSVKIYNHRRIFCMLSLAVVEKNGALFIQPMFIGESLMHRRIGMRYYLNPVNKRRESTEFMSAGIGYFERGFCFGQDSLLPLHLVNPKSGYLEDGALTYEFGWHLESFQEEDEIWRFNFQDWMAGRSNTLGFSYMINPKMHYSHKQYLVFHSEYCAPYDSKLVPRNYEIIVSSKWGYLFFGAIENLMQIAHGVRLQLDVETLPRVAQNARVFKLYNVVRYCEDQLIRKYEPEILDWSLPMARKYRLHRYLKFLLKQVDSLEQIKCLFTDENLPTLSADNMKFLVEKFLRGDLE